ncbi:MAG TPA: winged helix DNA-binding domain-containing protein [Coriobacteriia bacterium]|nr:winged helix DNA-binding domain-containing protein [Coriobacteriia bacterium]
MIRLTQESMVLDIRRQRLVSQHISHATFRKPEEVVAYLGAMQAQDYAAAKWAVGLRMLHASDQQVEQAFNTGDILRTHVLRPTWHFVTPEDIGWMLALTAPRVHAANAHMYRRLELDDTVFERSQTALLTALQGGQYRTRNELREVLGAAGVVADAAGRMSYLMMHAELDGIVCSGPRRGRQFTYALLDERAPLAKRLDRDAALAELAQRYFVSRGPSRVNDLAKWSGLSGADARRGLAAVRDRLQRECLGDEEYWSGPLGPTDVAGPTAAHLLSVYDEYVSAYKGWSTIVDDATSRELIKMDNALNSIVVVDGRIVGTWKRTIRRHDVLVETNIMVPLTDLQERAVALAVREYGSFLGLPAVMA